MEGTLTIYRDCSTDLKLSGLKLEINPSLLFHSTLTAQAEKMLDEMIEKQYAIIVSDVRTFLENSLREDYHHNMELLRSSMTPAPSIMALATFERHLLPLHSNHEIELEEADEYCITAARQIYKFSETYAFVGSQTIDINHG